MFRPPIRLVECDVRPLCTDSMAAQELRTDPLTGRQSILAAERNDRPQTIPPTSKAAPFEAFDPFLEGNESCTPDESLALRLADSKANGPGWLLRVVPNRYPAVSASTHTETNAATGVHEVVIECPDQRSRLTELSVSEVARVLAAWQQRIRTLSAMDGIEAISVFRNEGNGAGASLPHSHSQIVAAGFISQQLQQRVDRAIAFDKTNSQRLFREWLAGECNSERLVRADNLFAVLCPFASRVDCHTRIVPVAETSTLFAELTENELANLAATLHAVVAAHEKINGPADHNLNLILPPTGQPDLFPWMLDFLPRKNRFAGFEMMTDTDIVTKAPDAAAKELGGRLEFICSPNNSIMPSAYAWRPG